MMSHLLDEVREIAKERKLRGSRMSLRAASTSAGCAKTSSTSLEQLLSAAMAVSGLRKSELQSDRKTFGLVHARHIYAWLAFRFTYRSYNQICFRVGWKDHTTVIHSIKRIDGIVEKFKDQMPAEDATPEEWSVALWTCLRGPPVSIPGQRHPMLIPYAGKTDVTTRYDLGFAEEGTLEHRG